MLPSFQRDSGDLSSSDHAQPTFQFPHSKKDRAHPRLRTQVRCLHKQAKASHAHGLLQTFLMAGAWRTEGNRLHPTSTPRNSRAPCLVAPRYRRSTSKPNRMFAAGCWVRRLQIAVHKLVREIALAIDSPDAPRWRHAAMFVHRQEYIDGV